MNRTAETPAVGHDPPGMRDFDRSLPMALMRAREAVMRRFRPILAAHGLTEQQWRVLRALADADDSLSVGSLADATFLLGPSLSRMLTSLERRGLVSRAADLADGRRAEVAVTGTGRRLVAEIAPASEAQYASIEARLADGELDDLHRLLHRLADL